MEWHNGENTRCVSRKKRRVPSIKLTNTRLPSTKLSNTKALDPTLISNAVPIIFHEFLHCWTFFLCDSSSLKQSSFSYPTTWWPTRRLIYPVRFSRVQWSSVAEARWNMCLVTGAKGVIPSSSLLLSASLLFLLGRRPWEVTLPGPFAEYLAKKGTGTCRGNWYSAWVW